MATANSNLPATTTDLATRYPGDQYHVLVQVEDLQAHHEHMKAELVVCHVDPTEGKGDVHMLEAAKEGFTGRNGQHYPAKPAKLMLAKPALDKVAAASGISIRVEVDKIAPKVWVGRAIAARRLPDGTPMVRSAEYEWDAELEAEIAEHKHVKTAERYNRQPKPFDRKGLELQHRQHGHARADTGARTRVICAILGLKRTWDEPDLAQPFVFARQVAQAGAPPLLMANPLQTLSAADLAAAPTVTDDEIPDETIAGTAEELPDMPADDAGDDFDDAGASAAFDGADQPDLFGSPDPKPAKDEAAPDPLAEAAKAMGMKHVPTAQEPVQRRLCELWPSLKPNNRQGLIAAAPADWSEGAARPFVEKIQRAIGGTS